MPHRTVFPSQAVLAIMILSLIAAAPAPAGDRAKVRKPRLDLRATPRFSFTPSTVRVTAEPAGRWPWRAPPSPCAEWAVRRESSGRSERQAPPSVSAWIMTSSARSEASSRRLVRGSVES